MTGTEGLIFDLDHTLYSLANANEAMFLRATIEAALELAAQDNLPLSREEAETLLQHAPEWARSDVQILIRERGFDEERLFELFNRHAFAQIGPAIEKGRDPRLHDALLPFAGKAVIVTHSARYWAERAVRLLGLDDIFPPERILALDDPAVNFRGKHESTAPFDAALAILGLPPEKVAVVEDTSRNLVIPHDMGMTTVLLTWGADISPADYPQVDRFYETAVDFLQSLPPPRLARGAAPGLSP